uniref:Amidohydrolase 3 domain-containing protein n=1 Tax=Kalanchoe fedtschenkoi TaxID=63787 RepID=A0A7N0UCH5_KALFE
MKLLIASIPEVSVDERKEALLRASNLALARGVTTVVDVGRYFPGASVELSWEDLSDVYRWADSTRQMKIRVCLFFPIETWSRLKGLIRESGRKLSDWIFLGGVKAFSDGSLGSNSALFHEVAIHAIGDRANHLILDLYESVISANGVRDRRLRIEHAQHLAAASAKRFGRLGVIASVQPDHLLDDADSAAKKLGIERANRGSYLFKTLLSQNAELSFGSDWPVAEINPLKSIKTAMFRKPPGWEMPWIASECVTLNEALKAYTISAARACFLENEVGSLSPGKLADFVILSANSLDAFAMDMSVHIEATYVGGVKSYP